jgi:ATP-dependent RNA helicase DeaD
MDKLMLTDISHGDYETYLPALQEKFATVTKEEILKRVAAMEFDRFLKYYENAEDLNLREGRERSRIPRKDDDTRERAVHRDTRGRKFSGGNDFTKLFVNLGTKDGFYKASFLQFILDMSELQKEVLGRVDLKEMNSWIEINKGVANQMIRSIDGKKFKGRKIRMNPA